MTNALERNESIFAYDAARQKSAIVDIPMISFCYVESDLASPSTTATIGMLTRDPIGFMGSEWNLSRDPIGFEGSKWLLYRYADGNPLIKFDPSGEVTIGCNCKCDLFSAEGSLIDISRIQVTTDCGNELASTCCTRACAAQRRDPARESGAAERDGVVDPGPLLVAAHRGAAATPRGR